MVRVVLPFHLRTLAHVDGEVELVDELTNGTPTQTLLRTLKPYSSEDEILLVGHMPSLSEHLAALIGSKNPQGLPLGKACVACIDLDELRFGRGQLRGLGKAVSGGGLPTIMVELKSGIRMAFPLGASSG